MIVLFILLQIVLLLFMLFHDWVPIPPLNDVKAIKTRDKVIGSLINSITVLIPLALTLRNYDQPNFSSPEIITILFFYLLLTIGTILSWWVPYFRGSSKKHKEAFSKFRNTHHFLPARKDHVIPNTLHVILHLQVWGCLLFAIYFLVNN